MFSQYIGKASSKMKNTVERGAVKKFAEAIGDLHPIYIDEEFGKKSRYKRNIAPPTFPIVFDYGVIEGFHLPKKGLIHGEQRFFYKRPLFVGEDIYCYTKIIDCYEKQGSQGLMSFLVLRSYGDDEKGENIFHSEQVIIINEIVKKGMNK